MKATLEFDLKDFDDRVRHDTAINGWRWKLVVTGVLDEIRNKLKKSPELSTDEIEALECIREHILSGLDGLDLND